MSESEKPEKNGELSAKSERAPRRAEILCDFALKFNYASYHAAVPVLRELQAGNPDKADALRNIVIEFSGVIDDMTGKHLIHPKEWRLDSVAPGEFIAARGLDLQVDGAALAALAEGQRGSAVFRVRDEGGTLAEETRDIEILAHNEWGGGQYMPELLSVFCQPNASAVAQILRSASTMLAQSGRKESLEGYQSGSRQRVWEIASAVYGAVANLDLTYVNPPASFESNGQKIRTPDDILNNRQGTCLDLAVLLASALEAAGLNPLIALPKGHALVGVWLQKECLAAVTDDSAETLRKRADLKELILIETTLAAGRRSACFSEALEAGAKEIKEDDNFESVVDIRRARLLQLKPLPGPSKPTDPPVSEPSTPKQLLAVEAAPSLPDFDSSVEPEPDQDETPESRLERWARKLLDLSVRNPLLNHRDGKSSVPIVCPNPGELEDLLAQGKKFSIRPPESRHQDDKIHSERTGENLAKLEAENALNTGHILVQLTKNELDARMVEIYRRANSALQESGTNTLYLALGFLEWRREGENRATPFRAPLILLPISLERKSVKSGIRLAAGSDEARFNTTLLEMLRRDFALHISGLDDELPTDHAGINVPGIWRKMREAVRDAEGLEVRENVVLGHFSFAKYLMWKDLMERTDDLKKNKVVRHLLENPKDPYGDGSSLVNPCDLDRKYRPADLLTALPTDSSQLAAVASADAGQDFVVIGPPGTGKSQTIANLIVHFLGRGKTALFVSEKTAALEVVYRRLEQIGLQNFCLRLHSNKAGKAEVVKQLKAAFDLAAPCISGNRDRQAKTLEDMRNRLNEVVEHLHAPYPNGLTPRDAMAVSVRHGEAPACDFPWTGSKFHDEAKLGEMRGAVNSLAIQAREIADINPKDMALVAGGEWTPLWEKAVWEAVKNLKNEAPDLEESANDFCGRLGTEWTRHSLPSARALAELAELLVRARDPSLFFALATALRRDAAWLGCWEQSIPLLERRDELRAALKDYPADAWRRVDADELGSGLQRAIASGWLVRWWRIFRLARRLRAIGRQGKPDPLREIPLLARWRKTGDEVEGLGDALGGPSPWRGMETALDVAREVFVDGKNIRELTRAVAAPNRLSAWRESLAALLNDGAEAVAPESDAGKAALAVAASHEKLNKAARTLEYKCGAFPHKIFDDDDGLSRIQRMADALIKNRRHLRPWSEWLQARAKAQGLDLGELVSLLESGKVAPKDANSVFEGSYCRWFATHALIDDPVLRFPTAEHQEAISRFSKTDEEFEQTTAEHVRKRLGAALAGLDDQIRQRELNTVRNLPLRARRPVRRILREISTVLPHLTPCLMMSPLSIAQYLPTDGMTFDAVIFDEASQITVWDAVGSIARGRQVIVAGDNKQMPPTSFFQRVDKDSDVSMDDEGDLESILDEMLASGVPTVHLNWHYRSRRESLIAFSNRQYYDNRLVTFPSPDVQDNGVELVPVNGGFYIRGGNRTNPAEAKAIVAECIRRITHDDESIRGRSIGIVTFNSEQQRLIEDLLDRERRANSNIEWAFSGENGYEPIFVKNLETVQGDERDVILFSVTYGPDQEGKVTMNFGPLNREGGERRLNVALTRARWKLMVFSTLRADQIDTARTRAKAVSDLRLFLEYAEHGFSAFASEIRGSVGDFESPFEEAVAAVLGEMGWEARPQIGVSVFRVDLGIVHPDFPGRYLAGVECDGATYHRSATARDRDRIREGMLTSLGWKLVRIWSTDWWYDRQKSAKKVDACLRKLLEEDRRQRAD